jgi:hypothetical protein
MNRKKMNKEKVDLLYKIKSLEYKGIKLTKEYNINSDYNEIKFEYDRLLENQELQNSIKIQEKVLMTGISIVEFMNDRFDPFDLKLTGWSESVHENLNEYKDIFSELHEKYKTKSKTPPEIRLLISIFGSAFMFHFSQTVLQLGINNSKSSGSGMGGLGGLTGLANLAGLSGLNVNNTSAENGMDIMSNLSKSSNIQSPSKIDELLKNIESHNNI